MDTKKERKSDEFRLEYPHQEDMRTILHNAIRMHALYSGKRIKIVESSKLAN